MRFINKISKKKYKQEYIPKNKIYFSISSEGFGHSSRAIAIAREFDKRDILIGTYGYALDRLISLGIPCAKLPQELELIGDKGSFDVGKTIIKNHAWALNFKNLVDEEIKIIKEFGASCVVADGRLVPVMAADKLGIPCIIMTNQSAFYPFFSKNSALVRIFGRSFDWIMKTWLSSTEEILIPDFAPPHTVCLPNLSHNTKVMKRTNFVGPLVYWDEEEIPTVERNTGRPYIVVTIGGHAYRKIILDYVSDVAKDMPDVDFEIFSSFTNEDAPANVKFSSTTDNIVSYLKTADLVITHAGHSTAMELLTLGKQSIIIPDQNQIEQENNALRMKELGVSKTISYKELSCDKLLSTIKLMLDNDDCVCKAKEISDIAKTNKGREKAALILKDYMSRLSKY